MASRSALVSAVDKWLKDAGASSGIPLLPSFRARLIWCVKGAIAFGALSAFLLSGSTSAVLAGAALIPVGAIQTCTPSVGASVMAARTCAIAGMVGALYSIVVMAAFHGVDDQSNGSASGGRGLALPLVGIAVFCFLAAYSTATTLAKRVSMAVVVTALLVFYRAGEADGTATAGGLEQDIVQALGAVASITVGAAIGLATSMLPLPRIPTATAEVAIRLEMAVCSAQARLGALTLAFTQTSDNIAESGGGISAVGDAADAAQVSVRMPIFPIPHQVTSHDDPVRPVHAHDSRPSASWTHAERAPLLRADVSELHDAGFRNLPAIAKCVEDMHHEPLGWYGLACRWWHHRKSQTQEATTWFPGAGCCKRKAPTVSQQHQVAQPAQWHASRETYIGRVQAWEATCVRLQRIIGAMVVAEQSLQSSHFHEAFAAVLSEPLSAMVLCLGEYMHAASRQALQLEIRGSTRTMHWAKQQLLRFLGLPIRSDCAPHAIVDLQRSRSDLNVYVHRMLQAHETARRLLYKVEQQRRQEVRATIAQAISRHLSSRGESRQDSHSGHVLEPETSEIKNSNEGIRDSSDHSGIQIGGAAAADVHRLMRPSLRITAADLLDGTGGDHDEAAPLQWHSSELTALNAFLFGTLRATQMVMAAADATTSSAPVLQRVQQQAQTSASPEKSVQPTGAPRSWSTCCRTATLVAAVNAVRTGAASVGSAMVASLSWLLKLFAKSCAAFGFFPDRAAAFRGMRISLSMICATALSVYFRDYFGANVHYWAPITVAFLTAGDGAAFRNSSLRLKGTLIGSIIGYMIVTLASHSAAATGILVALWAGLMQYPRADPAGTYWSIVAAFTAAIVALDLGPSAATAEELALGRIRQTLLGIACFLVASNVVLPTSARRIAKVNLSGILSNIRQGMNATFEEFETILQQKGGAPHESASTADPMESLQTVDAALAAMPELLLEASAEPDLWRRPFPHLASQYTEITMSLRRALRGVRLVHQCSLALATEMESRTQSAGAAPEGAGEGTGSNGGVATPRPGLAPVAGIGAYLHAVASSFNDVLALVEVILADAHAHHNSSKSTQKPASGIESSDRTYENGGSGNGADADQTPTSSIADKLVKNGGSSTPATPIADTKAAADGAASKAKNVAKAPTPSYQQAVHRLPETLDRLQHAQFAYEQAYDTLMHRLVEGHGRKESMQSSGTGEARPQDGEQLISAASAAAAPPTGTSAVLSHPPSTTNGAPPGRGRTVNASSSFIVLDGIATGLQPVIRPAESKGGQKNDVEAGAAHHGYKYSHRAGGYYDAEADHDVLEIDGGPRVPMPLTSISALCLHTATFAVHELGCAVAELASQARKLVHRDDTAGRA